MSTDILDVHVEMGQSDIGSGTIVPRVLLLDVKKKRKGMTARGALSIANIHRAFADT